MKNIIKILLLTLLVSGSLLRAQDSVRSLLPGDILMLRVADELEMTQRITVPPDGKITYWLLEPVVVTNKTVAEVRQILYEMLDKDYIIKPALSVEVDVYSKQYINVVGMFLEPGRKELPVDRRIDIMDALALGRGFNPKASPDKIILRRRGQTFNYTKKQLDKMYEGGEKVMIEPDDTVEVGERVF